MAERELAVRLDSHDLDLLEELARLDSPGRPGERTSTTMRRLEKREAVTVLLGIRLAHKALAELQREADGTRGSPTR